MTDAMSMVPSVVVTAFAQSHVEGRCVLIFGSATGGIWEKVLDRGARLVHVCDPNAERLAEASARNSSPKVSFAPLSLQAGLALRDGAFDVGLVDNLAAMPDPALLLRRLKRALSSRGLAFITTPNPDAQDVLISEVASPKQPLDYYSLYDAVRTEFPVVRMLGQMPFVGYTVAELAPLEDPQPVIDADFVPGGTEEPEWFIAAASVGPFAVEPFTVVQLPMQEVMHHNATRQLREQLRISRHAERSAVERLARLEVQLTQAARPKIDEGALKELSNQLEQSKQELSRKEKWIAAVEARASAADTRADETELQLERLQKQVEQSDFLQNRVLELEKIIAAHATQIAAADQQVADASSELGRLETTLSERAKRIQQLESDVQALTRTGEQLVRELQAAKVSQVEVAPAQGWQADVTVPTLDHQVSDADTTQSGATVAAWGVLQAGAPTPAATEPSVNVVSLLEDRARLAADLHAACWRVQQLRAELEGATSDQSQVVELRNLLSQAEQRLQEQQVLIQQLASRS